MRTTLTLAAVLALTLSAGLANAETAMVKKPAACRDAKGHFMKCGAATTAAAPMMVKATCKDNTAWSGKQRAGACARHGGVKAWG